jgi:hypothetical protein
VNTSGNASLNDQALCSVTLLCSWTKIKQILSLAVHETEGYQTSEGLLSTIQQSVAAFKDQVSLSPLVSLFSHYLALTHWVSSHPNKMNEVLRGKHPFGKLLC